jgi:hypothetical protein
MTHPWKWILGGTAALITGAHWWHQRQASRAAATQNAAERALQELHFHDLIREPGPSSLVNRDVALTDQGERITLHVTADDTARGELRGFVISLDGVKHQRGDQLTVKRTAITEVLKA